VKAIVCRQYGGPEVAQIEDIPSPPVRPGTVRIAVRACAASFASLLVMAGRHQNRAPLPLTPGTEIAGVVTEVDAGVTRFRVGNRVIAGVQSGGYAQEAVVPEQTVFHLPDDIPFEIGAQFPTVYGTAFAALSWRANLAPGEVLLVHGAAGGSGLAAVQVGKALGATVIATAGSQEKLEALAKLGADHVLDHRSDWRSVVLELTAGRGADIVYDPVGGDVFDASLRCIAPDGRIIPMGFASGRIPSLAANIALVRNITLIGIYWGYYFGWGRQPVPPGMDARLREAYRTMFDWVRDGRFEPRVHAAVPLAEFGEALRMIASREAIGRVVMLPM
jgi:NADPH2:quinone reductase